MKIILVNGIAICLLVSSSALAMHLNCTTSENQHRLVLAVVEEKGTPIYSPVK